MTSPTTCKAQAPRAATATLARTLLKSLLTTQQRSARSPHAFADRAHKHERHLGSQEGIPHVARGSTLQLRHNLASQLAWDCEVVVHVT